MASALSEPVDLTKLLVGRRRVLVVGMGGGCDVFAAYAVARYLRNSAVVPPETVVLFANCISPRDSADFQLVDPDFPYLFRAPDGPVRPLPGPNETASASKPTAPGGHYGTVVLEASLPRLHSRSKSNSEAEVDAPETSGVIPNSGDSPYLLVVPEKRGELAAVTAANCAAMQGAVSRLGADFVIGVDNGGDSLTGGVDFADGDPELGRDRQVLTAFAALNRARNSRFADPSVNVAAAGGLGEEVPFAHLVLGPGCDGESSAEDLGRAMMALEGAGAFLGALDLVKSGIISSMYQLTCGLAASRTPNVMHSAAVDELEKAEVIGEAAGSMVVVQRNLRPAIPREWLTRGFLFDGGKELAVDTLALRAAAHAASSTASAPEGASANGETK